MNSNCPICSKGKVFKGYLNVYAKCQACDANFEANKVGDAAAWLTTFLMCILCVPLSFLIDHIFNISLFKLALIMLVIILLLTILLLRITRYLLILRIMKLENGTKK